MVIVLNLIVIIKHVSYRRHINNTYHVMSGRPVRGEQRQQLVRSQRSDFDNERSHAALSAGLVAHMFCPKRAFNLWTVCSVDKCRQFETQNMPRLTTTTISRTRKEQRGKKQLDSQGRSDSLAGPCSNLLGAPSCLA